MGVLNVADIKHGITGPELQSCHHLRDWPASPLPLRGLQTHAGPGLLSCHHQLPRMKNLVHANRDMSIHVKCEKNENQCLRVKWNLAPVLDCRAVTTMFWIAPRHHRHMIVLLYWLVNRDFDSIHPYID